VLPRRAADGAPPTRERRARDGPPAAQGEPDILRQAAGSPSTIWTSAGTAGADAVAGCQADCQLAQARAGRRDGSDEATEAVQRNRERGHRAVDEEDPELHCHRPPMSGRSIEDLSRSESLDDDLPLTGDSVHA